MRIQRWRALVGAVGAVVLTGVLAGGPVAADPLGDVNTIATGGVTPGFTANSQPDDITVGSDGNLWFIQRGTDSVARITPDGTATEFPLPGGGGLSLTSITSGPDDALWIVGFDPPGNVFRVTTSGAITTVGTGGVTPGFSAGNVQGIVTGPDGNLWIARPFVANGLMRVTPGGVFTEFGVADGLAVDATPRDVVVGPDGALWFTDSQPTGRIWRFDLTTNTFNVVATTGVTPGFTAGNFPGDIVNGPDGNLWFLFDGPASSGIARITPAGAVTEFTDGLTGDSFLRNIAVGCDGALWFTQAIETNSEPTIWRAATDGTLTAFPLAVDMSPEGIVAGPGENLWFTNRPDPGSVNTIGAGDCSPEPPPTSTPSPTPSPTPDPLVIVPTFTG